VQYALALDIVVHAGKLLDGIFKEPRSQVSIVISGDRIVSVEPVFVDREGARITGLSRSTVLPGLIDLSWNRLSVDQHRWDRVWCSARQLALKNR
jgi:imidazolonepropionase-like amidohydrolase